jgi:hypothetical protein
MKQHMILCIITIISSIVIYDVPILNIVIRNNWLQIENMKRVASLCALQQAILNTSKITSKYISTGLSIINRGRTSNYHPKRHPPTAAPFDSALAFVPRNAVLRSRLSTTLSIVTIDLLMYQDYFGLWHVTRYKKRHPVLHKPQTGTCVRCSNLVR